MMETVNPAEIKLILERGLELVKTLRQSACGFGAPMFPWEIDAAALLDILRQAEL